MNPQPSTMKYGFLPKTPLMLSTIMMHRYGCFCAQNSPFSPCLPGSQPSHQPWDGKLVPEFFNPQLAPPCMEVTPCLGEMVYKINLILRVILTMKCFTK